MEPLKSIRLFPDFAVAHIAVARNANRFARVLKEHALIMAGSSGDENIQEGYHEARRGYLTDGYRGHVWKRRARNGGPKDGFAGSTRIFRLFGKTGL